MEQSKKPKKANNGYFYVRAYKLHLLEYALNTTRAQMIRMTDVLTQKTFNHIFYFPFLGAGQQVQAALKAFEAATLEAIEIANLMPGGGDYREKQKKLLEKEERIRNKKRLALLAEEDKLAE